MSWTDDFRQTNSEIKTFSTRALAVCVSVKPRTWSASASFIKVWSRVWETLTWPSYMKANTASRSSMGTSRKMITGCWHGLFYNKIFRSIIQDLSWIFEHIALTYIPTETDLQASYVEGECKGGGGGGCVGRGKEKKRIKEEKGKRHVPLTNSVKTP